VVPGQQRGRNHRPLVVLSPLVSLLCALHRFRPSAQKKRGGIFVGGKLLDCRCTEVLCNEETPERMCKRILPVVMLLSIRFFSFLFHDVLRKFRTIVFFRLIFGLWWSHGLSGFFFLRGSRLWSLCCYGAFFFFFRSFFKISRGRILLFFRSCRIRGRNNDCLYVEVFWFFLLGGLFCFLFEEILSVKCLLVAKGKGWQAYISASRTRFLVL